MEVGAVTRTVELYYQLKTAFDFVYDSVVYDLVRTIKITNHTAWE